jgi:Xaa-Pro aminopeptidase
MKSDLDRLMAERRYDALLVMGASAHNAPMYYLANGATVTERSVIVKKRGADPVLYVDAMDRGEAERSGLAVRLRNHYDPLGLIRQENGDRLRAGARLLARFLADAGVERGTVAAFGTADIGAHYALFNALTELYPQYEVAGEYAQGLLQTARATKDAAEIRRIRAVGNKTLRVVGAVEDFLTSHRARRGVLVKQDGRPLTVGDVKAFIRQRLTEQNLADPGGDTIFSIGADAGLPHSRGRERDPIALGQTIIFDIFPAEPGGGYYFDFTRTWCLGHAPPEVYAAYEDVLATFKAVVRALEPGAPTRQYQALTCQLLEARGHPTIGSDPKITSGYIHTVAHGLGLDVHEMPNFDDYPTNPQRLYPGVVVTIEPGVYYPERGFGLRLEDCIWLNPETLKFETIGRYHKNLVLPIKKG